MKEEITRRGFLYQCLSFLAVGMIGILGCGKKPDEPTAKPPAPPEMTMEEKEKYVFTNCICKKCPSYVECGEKAGFCLVGKSKCIKEKKGCTCPDCPVTTKMGLKWGYYCTDGSAKSMMEAEKKAG